MEQYYKWLMGKLVRCESQFTSVVDRSESLIIAHHPASKVVDWGESLIIAHDTASKGVEAVLATMQDKCPLRRGDADPPPGRGQLVQVKD